MATQTVAHTVKLHSKVLQKWDERTATRCPRTQSPRGKMSRPTIQIRSLSWTLYYTNPRYRGCTGAPSLEWGFLEGKHQAITHPTEYYAMVNSITSTGVADFRFKTDSKAIVHPYWIQPHTITDSTIPVHYLEGRVARRENRELKIYWAVIAPIANPLLYSTETKEE